MKQFIRQPVWFFAFLFALGLGIYYAYKYNETGEDIVRAKTMIRMQFQVLDAAGQKMDSLRQVISLDDQIISAQKTPTNIQTNNGDIITGDKIINPK